MSRDHPSAVLKATRRTGLLNRQPSSRLVITVSKSVSSTSISLQARPIGPKSSSTKQVSRSMPGTIDGDGGIRNSNRVTLSAPHYGETENSLMLREGQRAN